MRVTTTVVLCIFLTLTLVVVKVYLSSRQEYKQAELAFATQNYKEAVTHYERAMLWYLPVGGFVEPSAKRLWQIAQTLEQTDKPLALETYRSLRSAFYAARSFYTPGQDWIDRTNPKIAVMMAENTLYSEADRKKSIAKKTEEALAILERPMKPDPGWSMAVVFGLLGWIVGTLLFIWKAFRKGTTEVMLKPALIWGGMTVIFYALWIIGMMRA